ncbi:hypothetical protein MKR65_15590 [Acinetobacter baumannii]
MCGALMASREAFELSERSSRKGPIQKSNDQPREEPKKNHSNHQDMMLSMRK